MPRFRVSLATQIIAAGLDRRAALFVLSSTRKLSDRWEGVRRFCDPSAAARERECDFRIGPAAAPGWPGAWWSRKLRRRVQALAGAGAVCGSTSRLFRTALV